MMECLRAKYAQNADCAALLLSTGGVRLVETGSEDNPVNRRWGEVDGEGQNLLGRMLMKARSEIGGPAYEDAELDDLLASGAETLQHWLEKVYPLA